MEKVKGQRSSKTWMVTMTDGTEVKVTGVTSAEDAMAKVEGSTSARPLRKFKALTLNATVLVPEDGTGNGE